MKNNEFYRYGTHIPYLADLIMSTASWTGPIMEHGSGMFSTPILDIFKDVRPMVSIERNEVWQARIPKGIMVCNTVDEALDLYTHYDIVLIDGPANERREAMTKVADRATFVVVHDYEDKQYNYPDELYKYILICDKLRPWTAIFSNERKAVPIMKRIKL